MPCCSSSIISRSSCALTPYGRSWGGSGCIICGLSKQQQQQKPCLQAAALLPDRTTVTSVATVGLAEG
jgi:hypothetical protein